MALDLSPRPVILLLFLRNLMKISNTVIIELTQQEAIKLAKILPDSLQAEDENEDFAATIKEEICKQVGIKSWDL